MIKPHTEEFIFKGTKVTRHQYPLRLAWACTIHKTQGLTVDQCVVSGKGTFLAGMQYVAMSRVTKLSGLYLIDFSVDSLYCDTKVKNALSEMTSLVPRDVSLIRVDDTVLTVIGHNIRSVKANFGHQKSNLDILKADIICVSETWLEEQDSSEKYIIENFEFIRQDREGQKGGGMAMYIRKALKWTAVEIWSSEMKEGTEGMCVQLDNGVIIVSIYRSPTAKQRTFHKMLKTLVERAKGYPTIIVGDFNENILNNPEQVPFAELKDFKQVITQSTYYAGSGVGSLLDHVYTNNCNIFRAGVIETYYSDHDAVFVQVIQDAHV